MIQTVKNNGMLQDRSSKKKNEETTLAVSQKLIEHSANKRSCHRCWLHGTDPETKILTRNRKHHGGERSSVQRRGGYHNAAETREERKWKLSQREPFYEMGEGRKKRTA